MCAVLLKTLGVNRGCGKEVGLGSMINETIIQLKTLLEASRTKPRLVDGGGKPPR